MGRGRAASETMRWNLGTGSETCTSSGPAAIYGRLVGLFLGHSWADKAITFLGGL